MQERLGELIPSGLAPYLCISPPKSLYPDAERPLPDRRYESALPHPLLPKRLPGGLDGGAGSGPAHRVQGGRVLRALHFPTTPDSSSFSNPSPLKCWGWYKQSPSLFTHAAPYQWMRPQRAPSCLQPHCPWTCSVLCQECLFSALLFSRSNLRDSSSREALSVFPRENPWSPPLCSNRIQSAPLLQCLPHRPVILS